MGLVLPIATVISLFNILTQACLATDILHGCETPELSDHMLFTSPDDWFPQHTQLFLSCAPGYRLTGGPRMLNCELDPVFGLIWDPPLSAYCEEEEGIVYEEEEKINHPDVVDEEHGKVYDLKYTNEEEKEEEELEDEGEEEHSYRGSDIDTFETHEALYMRHEKNSASTNELESNVELDETEEHGLDRTYYETDWEVEDEQANINGDHYGEHYYIEEENNKHNNEEEYHEQSEIMEEGHHNDVEYIDEEFHENGDNVDVEHHKELSEHEHEQIAYFDEEINEKISYGEESHHDEATQMKEVFNEDLSQHHQETETIAQQEYQLESLKLQEEDHIENSEDIHEEHLENHLIEEEEQDEVINDSSENSENNKTFKSTFEEDNEISRHEEGLEDEKHFQSNAITNLG